MDNYITNPGECKLASFLLVQIKFHTFQHKLLNFLIIFNLVDVEEIDQEKINEEFISKNPEFKKYLDLDEKEMSKHFHSFLDQIWPRTLAEEELKNFEVESLGQFATKKVKFGDLEVREAEDLQEIGQKYENAGGFLDMVASGVEENEKKRKI